MEDCGCNTPKLKVVYTKPPTFVSLVSSSTHTDF